jgi:hypothetical protein
MALLNLDMNLTLFRVDSLIHVNRRSHSFCDHNFYNTIRIHLSTRRTHCSWQTSGLIPDLVFVFTIPGGLLILSLALLYFRNIRPESLRIKQL